MPSADDMMRLHNLAGKRLFATQVTVDKSKYALSHSSQDFPQGFKVNGSHCGIKKTGALDLGIAISTTARTTAAGVFTKNVAKAAPVEECIQALDSNDGQSGALIVNSGCANAMTGPQGAADSNRMSAELSELAGSPSLVMSTGVIGQYLPIERISSAISPLYESLGSTETHWDNFSKSFMTTDTFPKLRTRSFNLFGKQIKIAGITKGAGMIHPNMGPPHATLLGALFTDADVDSRTLQAALNFSADRSFNAITVDGDMSTNDSVVMMANGAAGNPTLNESEHPSEFHVFRNEVLELSTDLAKLVVRDGEGATKFVSVIVEQAETFEIAQTIARQVSTSALVKTALYGQDANWGRIVASSCSAPVPKGSIDPSKLSISFWSPTSPNDRLTVLSKGQAVNFDESAASSILAQTDIEICISLARGAEQATYWTCDFSHEYVTIVSLSMPIARWHVLNLH